MTEEFVTGFYKNAMEKGNGFIGQMDEEFQSQLAQAHAKLSREDCSFYHTMEFGKDEVIEGIWDLRGGERSYLGYVDLSGQRVLELGPASGHISFYMEKQGAEVVCFDLAPGMPQDIVPQEGSDLDTQKRLSTRYTEEVRNSWWYGHARLKSRTKVVYGDVYHLPGDMGRYDVSTFGCILLHLSRPFSALQQAAAITDKAIIVTETIAEIPDEQESTCMEFVPVDTSKSVVVWWAMRPGTVVKMLKVLGFFEISVYYHVQRHYPHHDLSKSPIDQLLFTVVGARYKNQIQEVSRSESEINAEPQLKRQRSSYKTKSKQLEIEIQAIKSSTSWRITKPVRFIGSTLRRLGMRQ